MAQNTHGISWSAWFIHTWFVGLFLLPSAWAAPKVRAQNLPSCEALSQLWTQTYYGKIRPSWGKAPLACSKAESQLTEMEKVSIITARAAYVLDKTVFSDYRLAQTPIVYWGTIGAPPANMLNWIAERSDGLIYDPNAASAYAEWTWFGNGKIHLPPADYQLQNPMETGLNLAGQLIHEARHLGHPRYGHVACTLGEGTGQNCDNTITEEFYGGGSHGIACLWMAWVVSRSGWPEKDRMVVKNTIKWVLNHRINDTFEIKNAWSMRYLGEGL